MQTYEYLALPAPRKIGKVKGLKTPSERFAHALTTLLNDVAAEGWEFWRSETLPSEERKGLTGTALMEHHLLIFRRPSAESLAEQLQTTERPHAPQSSSSIERERATRRDPVLLERPAGEQAIHDARREPMFRSQSNETQDRF